MLSLNTFRRQRPQITSGIFNRRLEVSKSTRYAILKCGQKHTQKSFCLFAPCFKFAQKITIKIKLEGIMIKFIGTNCVNLTLCAFEAAAAKNNKPT